MKGRLVAVMWDGDPDCRACDLRDAGWHVVLAEGDPGQALAVIRAEAPDCVLIDLDLRPADGRAVGAGLGAGVPVVFLSGETPPENTPGTSWTHMSWARIEATLAALLAGKDDPD
jgi:CheY-like chemotaxis protein